MLLQIHPDIVYLYKALEFVRVRHTHNYWSAMQMDTVYTLYGYTVCVDTLNELHGFNAHVRGITNDEFTGLQSCVQTTLHTCILVLAAAFLPPPLVMSAVLASE